MTDEPLPQPEMIRQRRAAGLASPGSSKQPAQELAQTLWTSNWSFSHIPLGKVQEKKTQTGIFLTSKSGPGSSPSHVTSSEIIQITRYLDPFLLLEHFRHNPSPDHWERSPVLRHAAVCAHGSAAGVGHGNPSWKPQRVLTLSIILLPATAKFPACSGFGELHIMLKSSIGLFNLLPPALVMPSPDNTLAKADARPPPGTRLRPAARPAASPLDGTTE